MERVCYNYSHASLLPSFLYISSNLVSNSLFDRKAFFSIASFRESERDMRLFLHLSEGDVIFASVSARLIMRFNKDRENLCSRFDLDFKS